jgi:Zn-dependent protease
MRLRLGSCFGVPIYLHVTFFLLPLWAVWSQPPDSPWSVPALLTLLLLGFTCVVLHEFGHVLMARYFGIPTQDVTLYPIGGVARLLRMTDKPLEEILIAVAGPAVNVAIAVLLMCLLLPIAILEPNLAFFETGIGQIATGLLVVNVGMVLFNLLPVFPMDGGRVVRALLALWLGNYHGTLVAVRIAFVLAILLAIGGIFGQMYTLPLIAMFVIFAGQQELMVASMRERQARRDQYEEPLEALPVWPRQYPHETLQSPPPVFPPRISVYTWDNLTGTWRKEPGTST